MFEFSLSQMKEELALKSIGSVKITGSAEPSITQ
jgi:hypothetical protein